MLTEGPPCHDGVTGYGNPEWGVMGIGIAPGRDEYIHKQQKGESRPFIGPAGQLLDDIAEACGWPREKWYLTNHYCHYNDSPEQELIDGCRSRVVAEIALVKPKLIIPFGDISTTQFYGKKSLAKHRGIPLWHPEFNCYVMPTYHPSAVLQGHFHLANDIIRDFQKIPMILEYPPENKKGYFTYSVINSRTDAQAFLDSLPKAPHVVTLDIEANPGKQDSADLWTDPLLCLAISTDGKHATVFPETYTRDLRWPEDICWGYSYGTYDTNSIKKYLGIDLPIGHDIVLQSYTVDERTPRDRQDSKTAVGPKKGIHGLKPQANEYENAAFYEDETKREWSKPRDHIDWDGLYKYNAGDACYTWRRIHAWIPQQKADNVYDLYNELLMPAYRRFSEQSYRGIKIDVANAHNLLTTWDQKSKEQEEYLQEYAGELGGPRNINLGSPKQLSEFIYGTLGLKHYLAPSTRKEALEDMDHPFLDGLLEWRTLRHMIDTYLLGVVDDLKADGRIHPNVLLHGTVTGRTAYSDPPMQTLPKPYSVGDLAVVRSIFCATNSDYVLVEADHNQIEMWLAWFFCQDPNMYTDLSMGDFHRRTASRILKKKLEDVTDHDKTFQGKKVNFGILYDVGDATLANKHYGIGCSVYEAHTYKQTWHQNYTLYEPWRNRIRKTAEQDAEIVTVTGRKRRFPLILPDHRDRQLKQAVNFPIQSTAGDYVLVAMIELHDLLLQYDSYILLDVHDSLVFELNRKYLHITLPLIAEVMERAKFDGYPAVKVDMTLGVNLYDMKPIRKAGAWL